MKVLVACEFSAIVRDAFRELGHDAYSCDIIPTERNHNYHYMCDVLTILDQGWDLMIAHPPCTYLANSGAKHLYDYTVKDKTRTAIRGKARWKEMEKGADFFNKLKNAPIEKICIENPIPHKHAKALIGEYTQIVRPWQFGHKEAKGICLWLKNLTPLKPTNIIKPPKYKTVEEQREWNKVHRMPESKKRSKERSRFYDGIAKAMAEQWS